MEQDDFIDTVQKFRTEGSPHHAHYFLTNRLDIVLLAKIDEIFGTEVRGHDDDRIAEIDRATLSVGQASVVQHLQQHVEHIRMCLFDLVEQDHLIGSAPNGFRQNAAFFIADIAGRRADQPAHGMLFHEFRHVDTNHGRVVLEEERGERLGQLRLADTSWAEEDERADRPVRVLKPGARTANRLRDGLDSFALPDDPLRKFVFHAQQLLTLAFQHPVNRNTGPA